MYMKSGKHVSDIGNTLICNVGCVALQVRIGCEGSVAQYGMVTVDDIAVGECLFEIPRDLVLGPDNCTIRQLLHEGTDGRNSDSFSFV